MEDLSFKEKRKYPRKKARIKIDFKEVNGDSFLINYTKNISRGGIFIETTKPLKVGTDVIIRFSHPEIDAELHVNGKVVWVNEYLPDSGMHIDPGMGINFRKLSESEWEIILNIVKKVAYL
jgi:type IV pilus assembly protein PilZ